MQYEPAILVTTLLVIALGFGINHLVRKAWKKYYEPYVAERKREQEIAAYQAALAALPQRWLDALMPDRDQFAAHLWNEYQRMRAGKYRLNDEYLENLIRTLSHAYPFPSTPPTYETPLVTATLADPHGAYFAFFQPCIDALIAYTIYTDASCYQYAAPTLFAQHIRAADTLVTETFNKPPMLTPTGDKAFRAFAHPFRDAYQQFQKFRITSNYLGHDIPYPEQRSHNYYSDDEKERKQQKKEEERWRKEYEKEQDERRKLIEQMVADAHPLEQLFNATPLMPYALHLLPNFIAAIPLTIDPELWFSSTWVCAPQGKGKTNLLHNLVQEHRMKGTIILMDAKGELTAPYLSQAIIVEPSLEHPPQINPLDIGSGTHAVELLEYVFSSLLESTMTPLQSTMFSAVLTLLTTMPNATMETFRDIVTNGWKPYEEHVRQLKPRDADFFLKEFDTKTYNDTKAQLQWRLRLLMRNEYMAAMLEAPRTEVDMGALMDSGRIVVIDNNPDLLGDLGAEFFGRFMLALLWNATRARSRKQGHKTEVYFFIDEAQTVISRDENIPKLIHQCRSQNVALIFAHQQLQQMKSDGVKAALTDCAIKFAAPDSEAAMIAPRFRVDTEYMQNLPKWHFAAAVRDQATAAVSVPLLALRATQKPRRATKRAKAARRPLPPAAAPQSGPEEFG